MGRGYSHTQASASLLFGHAPRGPGPRNLDSDLDAQLEQAAEALLALLTNRTGWFRERGNGCWEMLPEINQAAESLLAIAYQRVHRQHRAQTQLAELGLVIDIQLSANNPYHSSARRTLQEGLLDQLAAEKEPAAWSRLLAPPALLVRVARAVRWHLSVSAADRILDEGDQLLKTVLGQAAYQALLEQPLSAAERMTGEPALAQRMTQAGWTSHIDNWLSHPRPSRQQFVAQLPASIVEDRRLSQR
jgi:hypothetical protein